MVADRLVLHVTPNVNGWEVKRQGSDETEWLVDDNANAVEHAWALAKANQPSQIVIHTRDGRIETEYTYGRRPERDAGLIIGHTDRRASVGARRAARTAG